MKKINTIMVACDFSEYSKQALNYAAELAENLKADLVITHVINQRDVDAVQQATVFSPSGSLDEFIQRQTENRSRRIDKLIEKTAAAHLTVKKIIKIGVPFYELIQAAGDEDVDLVAMGPKGRGNLDGILFGTTAEKMSRHCPVPLLSIRGDQHMRE